MPKSPSILTRLHSLFKVILLLTIISSSSQDAFGQLSGDNENQSLKGLSALSFLGALYTSHQSAVGLPKSKELSESELIEAKEELLQFESAEQEDLDDQAFTNSYPILAKYLQRLKVENEEFRKLERNELLEIAYWRLLEKRKK